MFNTWYLPDICPSKIFQTSNRGIGYVTYELPPLGRHNKALVRVQIRWEGKLYPRWFSSFVFQATTQIYTFANIYCRFAWITHFDQFCHQNIPKNHFTNRQKVWNYLIWNYICMDPDWCIVYLTYCRMNDLSHTSYWKILISILRMSGYVI